MASNKENPILLLTSKHPCLLKWLRAIHAVRLLTLFRDMSFCLGTERNDNYVLHTLWLQWHSTLLYQVHGSVAWPDKATAGHGWRQHLRRRPDNIHHWRGRLSWLQANKVKLGIAHRALERKKTNCHILYKQLSSLSCSLASRYKTFQSHSVVFVIIAACAERDTYWMESQLAKSYNRNKKSRKRLSCQRNRNKALSYWTFTVCECVRARVHAYMLLNQGQNHTLGFFYLPSLDDHVIQHPGTIKGFAHCGLQCRACLPA